MVQAVPQDLACTPQLDLVIAQPTKLIGNTRLEENVFVTMSQRREKEDI